MYSIVYTCTSAQRLFFYGQGCVSLAESIGENQGGYSSSESKQRRRHKRNSCRMCIKYIKKKNIIIIIRKSVQLTIELNFVRSRHFGASSSYRKSPRRRLELWRNLSGQYLAQCRLGKVERREALAGSSSAFASCRDSQHWRILSPTIPCHRTYLQSQLPISILNARELIYHYILLTVCNTALMISHLC